MADYADLTLDEVKERERVRRLAEAQQAQLDARAAGRADPPSKAAPMTKTQGLPSPSGSSDASTGATPPEIRRVSNDPVAVLEAALDTAADDRTRAALLAAAPKDVRQQLSATLTYRRFIAGAGMPDTDRQFDELTQALDRAADDVERLAIIEGARQDPQRGPAFLGEWQWRRTGTADDWRRRYCEVAQVE